MFSNTVKKEGLNTRMNDNRGLYKIDPHVVSAHDLRGLPLVVGFTGFAEAGAVVQQVARAVLDGLPHQKVADFDIDQLVDYRSRRPQILFDGDHVSQYHSPDLALYVVRDELGRPFLFLHGMEPDLQWERFVSSVISLVDAFDVSITAWFHSIPLPVPHTRPVGVTVMGNQPDLINGVSTWQPVAQLSASVGHLLELRLSEAGKPVVGYAVHVPHYLSDSEYPHAAVSALEHLSLATNIVLPTETLRDASRIVGGQIAEQVDGSPDAVRLVSSLEERYDSAMAEVSRQSLLESGDNELPDAETLAEEFQDFLAAQGPDQIADYLRPRSDKALPESSFEDGDVERHDLEEGSDGRDGESGTV